MWNAIKTILIAMVFCAGLAGVCLAKPARMTAKEKRVKALELLDKHAETQNKQQSHICKWKVIAKMNAKLSDPPYSALSGKSRKVKLYEFRYDGDRYNTRWCTWGNVKSAKIFRPKDNAGYNSILWDGCTYFNYVATVNRPGRLSIYRRIEDLPKNSRDGHEIEKRFGPGSSLINVHVREYLILRKIPSLSVRDKTEKINGIDCYVVEAENKNTKYTLWIDPEHGYNTAKWQLEYPNSHLRVSLERVRFEKIDDVWVIVEGVVNRLENFKNGDFTNETRHCELTEIVLNPDHDALGSFLPDDILDRTMVLFPGKSQDHIRGATGRLVSKGRNGKVYDEQGRVVSYTWQNGKVVDISGKVVMDCLKKGKGYK
jgi:hypothetical protein